MRHYITILLSLSFILSYSQNNYVENKKNFENFLLQNIIEHYSKLEIDKQCYDDSILNLKQKRKYFYKYVTSNIVYIYYDKNIFGKEVRKTFLPSTNKSWENFKLGLTEEQIQSSFRNELLQVTNFRMKIKKVPNKKIYKDTTCDTISIYASEYEIFNTNEVSNSEIDSLISYSLLDLKQLCSIKLIFQSISESKNIKTYLLDFEGLTYEISINCNDLDELSFSNWQKNILTDIDRIIYGKYIYYFNLGNSW